MKLQTEIGGNIYTFQLTRNTYKMLLADKEYARIQNEALNRMSKKAEENPEIDDDEIIKETSKEAVEENMVGQMLNNMINSEKIFYYALKEHHPAITMEEADKLIDIIFEEDGSIAFVNEIAQELLSSFTQGAREKTERKARVVTRI